MRLKVYETSAGEEEELQQLLTAQSEVESLGVVKLADLVRSIEDRRGLAVMEQTTKKLEGEDALPHRFVINPKKPNRLRRVYDASAKFRGQSLNDKMYTGPDYLSSLFGVLLRFCEGRIALAADVREMYHMLRLPESDQPVMRFLWRESPSEEQSVYVGAISCQLYNEAECGRERGRFASWSQSRLQVFLYGRWPTVQRLKRRSHRNAETNDGITAPWRLLPAKVVNKRP